MAKAIVVLALGLIITSHLSSCTKTETVTQWDTTYVHVHDTVGPAMIRFISVLPDSFGTIFTVRASQTGLPIATVRTGAGSYLPVRANVSSVYYLYNQNGVNIGAIPLPAFKPNTISSIVLFYDNNGLGFTPADDSQKVIAAPQGHCYVRFINDIPDHTLSTLLSIDTDAFGHSLVQAAYEEASPYGLITAGNHMLLIHAQGDQPSGKIDTISTVFQDGSYYTVFAVGSQAAHTAKYTCLPEY